MNIPKIISIGYTVPPNSYTQDEIWRGLNYRKSRINPYIFFDPKKSQIDKRHFWVDFVKAQEMSWQELQEEYFRGAMEISKQSIELCLDGRDPGEIGCLVFVSCTGYQCPSIAHHLSRVIKLSHSIYYTNMLGMGCEGGFPGLKRAYDFTIASGKPSLVLATELCSCCFFPEPNNEPDPENDYELARAKALFADASAAVLVGYDDNPRHPYILDSETYTDSQYIDHLGFTLRDGRWRVLLSRDVKSIAPKLIEPAASTLLNRRGLKLSDIEWLVIHAGGAAVLDNLQRELGIPEKKMRLSREALREYGNCSSTSIGIIGKKLMGEDIHPGDRVLVLSVGPGMVGGVTYLRFPQ